MRSLYKVIALIFTFAFMSCSSPKDFQSPNYLISHDETSVHSSSAGNLAATAIQKVHDIDIVLVPSQILSSKESAILNTNMSQEEVDKVINLFPQNKKMSKFKTGTMKGREIISFLKNRSNLMDALDIQVAGIYYHIHRVGGESQYAFFTDEDGIEFDGEAIYRVALSDHFYKNPFPGYFFGAQLNHSFRESGKAIHLKHTVEQYLAESYEYPNLNKKRATVSRFVKDHLGQQKIYNIQGAQHRSPMMGHRVKTEGVVTVVGINTVHVKKFEFYIQDQNGDRDPTTSDAILVESDDLNLKISKGDLVSLEGEVYETHSSDGLSRTGLKRISNLKVLEANKPLPKPVVLGQRGRHVPNEKISSYRGDLNLKTYLNLDDGIDFWESLEGMRIQVGSSRVTGFRGSNEKHGRSKRHLDIYVALENETHPNYKTKAGGIFLDHHQKNFNPDVLQITKNHFSNLFLDPRELVLNVGDKISSSLVGILDFQRNIFGDGAYVFCVTGPKNWLKQAPEKKIKTLSEKGTTQIEKSSTNGNLRVATYNVENLSLNDSSRIVLVGQMIKKNLKCPDLVNLVEIQDDNGRDLSGGSGAQKTLQAIIDATKCDGFKYKAINIDPIVHAEGGQPGGNIRVAMIFNPNKLEFNPKGTPNSQTMARIGADGSLMVNPARVAPESRAFQRTRRSLVAEFKYKREKLFVVGNHFKSKMGDTSLWSNIQPPQYRSEKARSEMADGIRNFINILEYLSPNANAIVLGDFNAYVNEDPMKLLESETLINLMSYKNLVSVNDRYSTNYNGNSQPLDYIYVNKKMLNKSPRLEVLHINSDFMGRISDHDPLISEFQF